MLMDDEPASTISGAKRSGNGLVLYKKGDEAVIAFLSLTIEGYMTKSRWLKNGCVVGEFYAMTYVVSECGTHITVLKAEMCSAKPVLSRVVNGRVQILMGVCQLDGILTTPFGKICGIDRKALKLIDHHGFIMAWCSLDSVSYQIHFVEAVCRSELQKSAAHPQPLLQLQNADIATTMSSAPVATSNMVKSDGIVFCRKSETEVVIALLDATSADMKINLLSNGKVGDWYIFSYQVYDADTIDISNVTPIDSSKRPTVQTRVVNQTAEVLVSIFKIDDLFLSDYGSVIKMDHPTVHSVFAKRRAVKAWCTIDISQLSFTELCVSEKYRQASSSLTALSEILSLPKVVAVGLLLNKKGEEAVIAFLRELPATTKCAMSKWKLFPKGGVVGQYYLITYRETSAGHHIHICAAVLLAEGEFPVTRVIGSCAQISTLAFKKGDDFMTTYGRMGNIANDFVVTCIAKNGPVKIWCDIHPTTNLFHFKELDRVCSAGAVVGPLDPPKILALEKVANSKSSTSIGVLIRPSSSLSTLSSSAATTSTTDTHSAASTADSKKSAQRASKWGKNCMSQALVIDKIGVEAVLLLIDGADGKQLRKYYAITPHKNKLLDVQISEWYRVTFKRSSKSEQHISVVGATKMDFNALPTMVLDGVVVFLIPVFWSSKNKRVSSAYGIIDVSDDKAECIKRMTGPVKAWCVALKKNIFKIVTIHDEKEQFKKRLSSSVLTLSSSTSKTDAHSAVTTGVKKPARKASKWSTEIYKAQALIVGANKCETFMLVLEGDDNRMTKCCAKTTENTPVNVLIGEWYRLSFKRSLKDKHVHIPHILVINVQKSALNVPKTQIIDNEICFLTSVVWSSEKLCFSCKYGDFTDASADNAVYVKRFGRTVDAWCTSAWKGMSALRILHVDEDSEHLKQNVERWGCVRINGKALYSDRLVDASGVVVAEEPQQVFIQMVNGSREREVFCPSRFYVYSAEFERLMVLHTTGNADGPVGVGDWLSFKILPNTVEIVQHSRWAAAESFYPTLGYRDRVYVQCDVDVPLTYRAYSLDRAVFQNSFSECVVDAHGLITSDLAGTTLAVVVGSGSVNSYCFRWVIEAIRKIVKVNRFLPRTKNQETPTRRSYTRKQILSLFKYGEGRMLRIDPVAKHYVERQWFRAVDEYRKWIFSITDLVDEIGNTKFF